MVCCGICKCNPIKRAKINQLTKQVLFESAFGGLLYLLRVFVVDCVGTKHRAVAYGLTTFPYLVTPFAGPPMAAAYIHNSGWRWAFGTFAIMVPVVGAIMATLIVWGRRTEESSRPSKSFREYLIEFDGM